MYTFGDSKSLILNFVCPIVFVLGNFSVWLICIATRGSFVELQLHRIFSALCGATAMTKQDEFFTPFTFGMIMKYLWSSFDGIYRPFPFSQSDPKFGLIIYVVLDRALVTKRLNSTESPWVPYNQIKPIRCYCNKHIKMCWTCLIVLNKIKSKIIY